MVATLAGCGIMTIFGAVSTFVVRNMASLAAYGILGWWIAFLVGALIALLLAIGVAHFRYKLVAANAIRKWETVTDNINPLATEFTRNRINIGDLASPITRSVEKKRFVDCELMGPASIMFRNINAHNTRFVDCDTVVIKEGALIHNVVIFEDIQLIGGVVHGCTLYIPSFLIDEFVKMGATFVSLTGRANIDNGRS